MRPNQAIGIKTWRNFTNYKILTFCFWRPLKYSEYLFNAIENFYHKIHEFSQKITLKLRKYFNYVLSIGQQFTENGKIQIEVEKLKWELKNKYQELGKYVTREKETKSVVDFSHDSEYLQKINEILTLKFYIGERLKSKGTF